MNKIKKETKESKAVTVPEKGISEIVQSLVLQGDIGKMTDAMKVDYYNQLCKSLNLNPVTRPFQLISFQGKTVLYATKDCTEQLRKLNGVSVVELTQDINSGLCITKCKVQDSHGRFDVATGVVNISGLKNGDLANAIMKSETKAKRRATLSICGLGMLDESELDTMPDYKTADISKVNVKEPEQVNPFKQAANATNKEELLKCYNDNPTLHNDVIFMNLLKDKKLSLGIIDKQKKSETVTVEDVAPEVVEPEDVYPEIEEMKTAGHNGKLQTMYDEIVNDDRYEDAPQKYKDLVEKVYQENLMPF